jgi:hypothetical protein
MVVLYNSLKVNSIYVILFIVTRYLVHIIAAWHIRCCKALVKEVLLMTALDFLDKNREVLDGLRYTSNCRSRINIISTDAFIPRN